MALRVAPITRAVLHDAEHAAGLEGPEGRAEHLRQRATPIQLCTLRKASTMSALPAVQ
jgi:hypothetical protein